MFLGRMDLTDRGRFASALVVCIVTVAIFYVGAAVTLTKLVENRGVSDDICYLRQAYLFRQHGFLKGLNTDSDDARYIAAKYRALNLRHQFTPFTNCEVEASNSEHVALQYPFGTGFLLSFFPPFAQSSWLYVASATLVFVLVCGALLTSQSLSALVTVAVVGGANVYMMVNPSKSSYSIAPTMPICIVLGFLTVWMFAAERTWQRVLAAAAAGFALGLLIDLRLSSALLAFGYAASFSAQFLYRRDWESFLRPAAFGLACLLAIAPLIASNVINLGGPFETAYRAQDIQPPDFSLSSLWIMLKWYGLHTHGVLLWAAVGLLAVFIVNRRLLRLNGSNAIIGILVGNLLFNMGYFLSHPVTSQYYTIPPTILTIWTIVFAWHASEWSRSHHPGGKFRLLPSMTFRIWSAAGVACALVVFLVLIVSPILARKAPPGPTTISLEPNAIIWTSGVKWRSRIARALEIYLDRHTIVNFDTAPPEAVDALIASIAKDGRPQYFVVDKPAMSGIAKRASAFGEVRRAGELYGLPVDRLEAGR